MSPDNDLVKAYSSEGSEAAFRALVVRHVDLVYATALRQVGDSGMAEEISQNVFVTLARKAPRLAGIQTLAGWLHRTTILECKARVRMELRRRRREETMIELSSIQREGTSPLEAMVPLLDEGLLNLGDKDRLVLVLRFLEERSLRDVGGMLGVNEEAARKRVARALGRLTDFFRERGFTVSAGVGISTVFAGTTKAAPAGLALSVANAGFASGGVATGLNLFLLQFMTLSKTQLAVICLVLIALPMAWQQHAIAQVETKRVKLAGKWVTGQHRVDELESEARRTREASRRVKEELAELGSRLAMLRTQLQGKLPHQAYLWDDSSLVARIPKSFLEKLPMTAVANKRGQLSQEVKEALQFTESEADKVQSAIDQFLAEYYSALAPKVKPVTPVDNDLQGHKPEDTRVFAVTALGEELGPLRAELFTEIEEALGPKRFQIFHKALGDWIPLTDEYTGLNSSTAIFNFDHRVRVYKPQPGTEWLDWGIGKPNGEMMSITIQIEDIPPILHPKLEDWISLAQSPPAHDSDPQKTKP